MLPGARTAAALVCAGRSLAHSRCLRLLLGAGVSLYAGKGTLLHVTIEAAADAPLALLLGHLASIDESRHEGAAIDAASADEADADAVASGASSWRFVCASLCSSS